MLWRDVLWRAETVPEECRDEVYNFMIVRGKNINANIPLGESHQQQLFAPPIGTRHICTVLSTPNFFITVAHVHVF